MAVVIARLRSRRSGYELSTLFALLFGLSLPVEAHNNAVTLGAETGTIQGQVVPAGRGRGHWRTYGVPDGLGGAIVLAIFQDRDGYLWLSTDGGGVSRFDGETFISVTGPDDVLARNTVFAIYQDREGHLWFGSYGGAIRYDGEAFATFTTEDGLVDNRVRAIVQDREGYLWFGTQGGAHRSDGGVENGITTIAFEGVSRRDFAPRPRPRGAARHASPLLVATSLTATGGVEVGYRPTDVPPYRRSLPPYRLSQPRLSRGEKRSRSGVSSSGRGVGATPIPTPTHRATPTPSRGT